MGYKWSQTQRHVTVSFEAPEASVEGDVFFELTSTRINAGITGYNPSIQGALHMQVTPDTSSWRLIERDGYCEVLVTMEKGVALDWMYVSSEPIIFSIHSVITLRSIRLQAT